MMALRETRDAGTDLLDAPHARMSKDPARLAGRHIALQNVQIRSADRRTKNSNQYVEFANRRNLHFIEPKTRYALFFYERFHHLHKTVGGRQEIRSTAALCKACGRIGVGGVRVDRSPSWWGENLGAPMA
jgi:hypothetical protein